MDAAEAELLGNINSFRFESVPVAFSFVDRLAQENDWRIAYADRVVQEYKYFLFLAMTAAHPVSPSDPVDQVWHLHMIYTRSYWDELCGKVLMKPLHHGPTLGGPSERVKHDDWYSRTLESYQRKLGHAPPEDIWPTLQQLRHTRTDYQRVDRYKYWLVPKFRVLSWFRTKFRNREH